jgi:hypothetical protein
MLVPTIIFGILAVVLVWQSWNSGTTNDNSNRGRRERGGLDITYSNQI